MHKIICIFTLLILPFCMKAAKLERYPSDSITVWGKVLCEGKPLKGVIVSDGVLFTKTDSLGVYALPSLKFQQSVFVITPSGYQPVTRKGIYPTFWASLNDKKRGEQERHDFILEKVDDHHHKVVIVGDLSLSGRNEDFLQFKRMAIPTLRRTKEEFDRDSIPSFSVLLGDLGSNTAWYSRDIDVGDVYRSLSASKYPFIAYPVIGEGDHDGAVPFGVMTDFQSERAYREGCGPKYYSFNKGEIHYVVLDNTVFLNEPGDGNYPTEIMGKRNHNTYVTDDQIAWLREDLALVDSTKRVVLFMHLPFIKEGNKRQILKQFTPKERTDSLMKVLSSQKKKVHVFTAHTHRRQISSPRKCKVIEHNIPAISGYFWESAYLGFRHIGTDGNEGGFEILEATGDSLSWSYRTLLEGDRTFRAYDMNEVSRFYRENKDIRAFFKEHNTRTDYGMPGFNNKVYINYWGKEPKSRLEVTCSGKELPVKQIYQDDPLYTMSITLDRFIIGRSKKNKIGKNSCSHMYYVICPDSTSTVHIKSISPFNVIYEDSLVRPSSLKLKQGIIKVK